MRKLRLQIFLALGLLIVLISLQNPGNPVSAKTAGEKIKQNESSLSPDTATFSELARLIAPDGAGDDGGDQIGRNVAISGNTAIVGSQTHNIGANVNQGAAYVFVRSGASWTFQQKLVAPDGGFQQGFANSVAISGDFVLVGASTDDGQRGAVYAFTRSGSTWSFQQKIVSILNTEINQQFGASVAMTDTTAIIGSPGDTIGANGDQGSAYIYTRSGSSWGFQARIMASDGAGGDEFGGNTTFHNTKQVDINGDTAIVGVIGGNFSTNAGAAYVYTRSGSSWSQQQKLTAFDAQTDDQFGASVAVSGNTAIIGANADDNDTRPDDGSAYVFTRSGSVWSLQQKLIGDGDNTSGQDAFGTSVAILGNTVLVGTPGDDLPGFSGFSNRGAAFLFKRTGTTWTYRAKFIANTDITTNPTNHSLGFSVALTNNAAIAGAPSFDATGNGFVGAAYLFNIEAVRTPFDFDGDGKTDIGIFRPSSGEWWVNRSSTFQTVVAQFGAGSDKIVPGDFSGDGRSDIAFFRPSTGEWFILRSEDGSFYSVPFGTSSDVPVPADYDGDGKTDVAVFRPSTQNWFISKSTGGTIITTFGIAGDVPVTADYDGDGKADLAIYRPSNGQWWYSASSDSQIRATTFGVGTDKPVPGDYTGDGKADLAFFRPSSGEWFIIRSEDNSFFSFPFGTSGDVPTPGDYDGDGKFDTAVFRPSGSNWFLNQTTAGVGIVTFGIGGDRALPNAFVP